MSQSFEKNELSYVRAFTVTMINLQDAKKQRIS
jgi:hypothetical protein